MCTDNITLDGDRPKQNKKSISSKNRKGVQSTIESNELTVIDQILQLTYIEEIIKHRFDIECIHKSPKNKYSLHGPGFILSLEDDLFIIYFEVDVNNVWVAELMKIICFVIDPTIIITGQEFYWDEVSNNFYFGDEAKEIKKERIASKQGYKKCLYCEKYVQQHKINSKTGCCLTCEKYDVVNKVTYH